MDSNHTNKNHNEISNEMNEQKDNVNLIESNNVDSVDSSVLTTTNQPVDNADILKDETKEKKNWFYQLWHGNEILIILSLGLLLVLMFILSDYQQERAEINKESERLDKEKAQYVSDKKLPSEYWCTTFERKLCFLPTSYKLMNAQYKQSFYQFINQHFPGEASYIDNYLNIRDNPEKYSSNNERINYIYLIIKHKSLVNIDEAIQRMDELNGVIFKEKINSELEERKSVSPSTVNKTLTNDNTNLMPQKDNAVSNISAEPIIYPPPVINNVIDEFPEPNAAPQPTQQSTISITKIK